MRKLSRLRLFIFPACVEKSSLSRIHVCRKVSNDLGHVSRRSADNKRVYSLLACRYPKDVVYI